MKCLVCKGSLEKVERYDAIGQDMFPNAKDLSRKVKKIYLCISCNRAYKRRVIRIRQKEVKTNESQPIHQRG